MRLACGLAVLLVLAAPAAQATTRVALGHASVVFPRGEPKRVVLTPEQAARALARLQARTPSRPSSQATEMNSALVAGESWIVMDAAHGVSFLATEIPTTPSFRRIETEKCAVPKPSVWRTGMACRDVRIGDAVGMEFDSLRPDGAKSARLMVSKAGRTYLLNYTQLGQASLARLKATPANDDPRAFLGSFRLDGAKPVWR